MLIHQQECFYITVTDRLAVVSVNIQDLITFLQGNAYQFLQVLTGNSGKHRFCRTESICTAISNILPPTAPWIVFYLLHHSRFQWVLMNIPEQGDKIFYTVNWLTSESVQEQMSVAFVFLIKVMSICHSDYLYDIADVLFTFLYQQMNMVAHQAICIERTKRRKLNLVFVTPVYQPSEYGNHLLIISFILKNVLSIDTTQHHVVDSRFALLP